MKMNNILSRPAIPILLLFVVQFVGAGDATAQASSKMSSSDDLVARTRELMSVTEDLRGLDFLYDLPVELVSTERIGEIIAEQLAMEITPEDDRQYSELYAMLGLMPSGSSLLGDYQQMAEEQVAGLYDPHAKRFYVVDVDISTMFEGMFADLGPLGSFLEGFLSGLDFDLTDTIIVHELTHALDDQHFDLEGNLEALIEGDSDDAQLAYMSLVEGNATRLMNNYTYELMGVDPSLIEGLSQMNMGLAEGIMDYNPFLERIMIAPYFNGEAFVNYLIDRQGMDGLNRAFIDPPQSMEQILHPERYVSWRDDPSYSEIPDLSRVLPRWHLETTDTLGELLIGVMFEIQTGDRTAGEEIADGWDYDVATTWRGPGNELALAWVTVWDDEYEAEEFFDEYCDLLEIKYPPGSWDTRRSDYALYTGMGLAAAVEQSGRVVVIVEGVPEEDVDACLDQTWSVRVTYR